MLANNSNLLLAIQIMNKNSIISERTKLRTEIKQLIAQYEQLRNKDDALGPFQEEEMFEVLNSIAMRYAKDGFIQKAQVWISKAEPFTKNNPRLAIILHNNASCVYKNQNQYDKALEHLKQSQRILKQIRSKPDYNKRYDRLLVDCWLNLSALYSSKKMHDEALQVINSAEALISYNLQNGFQKFLEQFVIARYNKIVELQHLGKLEQAYYCSDDTKRIMYEKRIYKHFLENKLNDLHHDLRKKLYGQNRHKRTLSMAPSITKLKDSIKLLPQKGQNNSKRLASVHHKNKTKLANILQSKENDNALTSRTTFNSLSVQRKQQYKRKTTVGHATLKLSSSPMMDIVNQNIPPR